MAAKFSVVLFCCFFLCYSLIYGQRENVWVFGYNAGIDFNSASPGTFTSSIHSIEAAASICDHSGQLLFYTEGNNIWDRYHNLMPDGDSLIADFAYSFGPTESTCGGALIVPYISNENKYYVFSLSSNFLGNNTGKLYYSTVDMTLNGGLGDVVATQKGILIDSQNTEHLTAVVGDRCNIWLLTVATPSTTTLQIRAYEITDAGVNNIPVVSNFSIPYTQSTNYGQVDVSPDRHRIAVSRNIPLAGFGGATELYSFDPATGIASNRIMLDSTGGYGVAFSPDGSKLYKSEMSQYDLSLPTTAAIISSLTNVSGGVSSSGIIKRGPDGKMYVNGGNSTLSVVNYPNMPGTACGFTPNAISYSGIAVYSLPNIVPVITHDTFYHAYHISAPCFAASTTLTASNDTTGWDHVWNTGVAGTSATADSSGVYYVSYRTPPCNFNVDTFYVQFGTRLPVLSAISGCYHQNNGVIRANPYPGDITTYVYTWKDANGNVIQGPLATHTGDTLSIAASGNAYVLDILAPDGCDTSLKITVPVPGYHVSFSVSDTIVCADEPVAFQNTSTADITGFSWNFGDGAFSNAENPQHQYDISGVYTIQLIGSTDFPCYDTAYAQVTVDSVTGGRFETDRDSICTGAAIEFAPQTDASITGLEWQFGDGPPIPGVSSQPIRHAYDRSGNFPVTVTIRSRACPPVSHSDTVHVFPFPVVNLGDDTSICLNGSPVYLQNLHADSTVTVQSMHWSTGDTTAVIKVVHQGKYSLTVAAAPLGCSTTDEVDVHKDCYIDIPNAFTPNGDGINDYFFPRELLSEKLTAFKMQIFNRWGQVIFETNKIDGRGWDGKLNDRDQPVGVYVYIIDATIDQVRQEHYKGNVTLLR